SRVRMLAVETPALLRAFDLLAEGTKTLIGRPFVDRRQRLESLVASLGGRRRTTAGSIELTPMERTLATAAPWLEGGEGVIGKRLDAPYRPGERKGMVKVKRVRTADCVVGGWRTGEEERPGGASIRGTS